MTRQQHMMGCSGPETCRCAETWPKPDSETPSDLERNPYHVRANYFVYYSNQDLIQGFLYDSDAAHRLAQQLNQAFQRGRQR